MAKKKEALEKYVIWVDGSALGNPGPGGFAATVRRLGQAEVIATLAKGFFHTTNNRMEIMAVLETLKYFPERVELIVHSDSQYTIKGSESWRKGWRRNGWMTQFGEPVKNDDLWKEMDEYLNRHKVSFVKVKAHSGIPENEAVDQLAKAAASKPTEYDSNYIKP